MEEILVAVGCQNKAEALLADKPLDRAVHGRHAVSFGLLELNRTHAGATEVCRQSSHRRGRERLIGR
jgi:hypothetical protein